MKKNIITALMLAGIVLASGCTQDTQTSSESGASGTSSSDAARESSAAVNEDSDEKAFGGLSDYSGSAYSASAASGGMLCESDSGILLAAEKGIYRIEGGSAVKVYEGSASHLNSHNGRVSFVDGNGNICMLSDDKAKPVIEGQGVSALITCDTGNYYIGGDGALHRIYGSDMVISSNAPESIAAAEEYVFFTEDGGALRAYNSSTGKTVTVTEYGRFPAVSGEYLFYLSEDNGIERMELKNGQVLDIAEDCGSFVPANDVLYFVEENSIYSVSINGGEAETLYTASADTAVIDRPAYCGGTLYFAEDGAVKYLTEDGAAALDIGE